MYALRQRFDDMILYAGLVLLLAMIAQLTQGFYVIGDSGAISYGLVMLGSNSCPYCQSLRRFFDSTYKGMWAYLPIESIGTDLLYKIALAEINYGLNSSYAGATPHTLVFNNGVLVAIVIGDVESKGFWDDLMKLGATDKVPVYLGNSAEIEIPRGALTETLTKLETILNTTTTPQSGAASETTGVMLVVAGVMIFLAYIVMRKRR